MLLSDALAPDFSRRVIQRGDEYARYKAVQHLEGSAWDAHAEVRGTETYMTGVFMEPVAAGKTVVVRALCSCPHAEGGEPCKHLWALLVVAEDAGFLDGPVPVDGPVRLKLGSSSAQQSPAPTAAPNAAAQRIALGLLNSLQMTVAAEREKVAPTYRYANAILTCAIDLPTTVQEGHLVICIAARTRKKDGTLTHPKRVTITDDDARLAPEEERTWLAPLMGARSITGNDLWRSPYQPPTRASRFTLSPALVADWLPRVAQQQRLQIFVDSTLRDIRPLAWDAGPPWQAQVTCLPRGDDGYVLSGHLRRSPDEMMPLSAVLLTLKAGFYCTLDTVGRLDPGPSAALIEAVRQRPIEVPAALTPRLTEVLAGLPIASDTLPPELRVEHVRVAPTPVLRVDPPERRGTSALAATISFRYGTKEVTQEDSAAAFDAERRQIIHRNFAEEKRALALAAAAGVRPAYNWRARSQGLSVPAAQLTTAVHTLIRAGWQVEAEGALYRTATGVRLSVSSGTDWFDLTATVDFGETSTTLVALLDALRHGSRTITLGDGSIGMLPDEWLRKYAPLAAAGDPTADGMLRFRRPQAALLDALLDARSTDATVTSDAAFAKVRAQLTQFTAITPMKAPRSFKGTLRDYQNDGLGWFQFLRQFGFGGCLADDMGLGKTVMVLALLAWWWEARAKGADGPRPSLVIAPRSVIHNWMAEAQRFAPTLVVIDASGATRHSQTLTDADLVLSTYGTLRRDITRLKDVPFEYVVLDEAQAIKNANTVGAKAVRLLQSRHRLALSGTPVENHLGELWSLFEFLNPGLLGRSTVFQQALTATKPDADTVAAIAKGLRPFLLRRTKAQVASELPARTEQTLTCTLNARERSFYDVLRNHYRTALLERVDRMGVKRSQVQILEALLRLRQAACHPGLIDTTRHTEPSSKFDLLVEQVRAVIDEGHKALVFSQFTSLLALLRVRLNHEGLVHEYLDGQTKDRQARVKRFQSDAACPLFLISLKAGGVGLNLTAADHVFLLDPWWNPAVEAQAIDRTHRIGQTRKVFAYRLIAENTVEEKVLALQQTKRALADAVLTADATGLRAIGRDDLEALLS
jgi:superfamily II DNA or RNA helicase